MPITKVKAPDGSIIKVNHPEGASQEEIIAFAQQQFQAPAPNVGMGGLTQEEIRSRRLAGVPLDEEEAAIMQRELLKEDGPSFLEGLLIDAGASFEALPSNFASLFGSEGADVKLQEIAQNREMLRNIQPGAVFGETAAIASTIPLGGGAVGALTQKLAPILGPKLASAVSAGLIGGTEGTAFTPSGEDPAQSAALGATLGVAGDVGARAVGAGLRKFGEFRRGAAREALGSIEETPALQEAVEEGIEATQQAQKVGVDLLPAQATGEGLRSQAFLTGHDLTARKAAKALQNQNEQVYNSLQNILNDIAPGEALSRFASKAREFSNLAIQKAKEARKMATEPLYKQVVDANAGLKIDTKPIADQVKATLEALPQKSTQKVALKQILGSITKGSGEAVDEVGQLHKARVDLGQFLYSGKGKKLAPESKGIIENYRRQLGDLLEDTVPGYAEANAKYAAESAPVTSLQEGVIGRVAELGDDQLKQSARLLLDPSNIDPSEVIKAKRVFESLPGGDIAWREVVRGELQRRLGSIRFDPSDIGAENVPSQILNKVFGNKQSQDALYRAVDQTTEGNLRLLKKVLEKASRGRTAGSPTAANQEVLRKVQPTVGKLARGTLKLKTTLEDWATTYGTDDNILALADKLFDPVVSEHLVQIRKSLKAENRIPRKLIEDLNKYIGIGAATAGTRGEQ